MPAAKLLLIQKMKPRRIQFSGAIALGHLASASVPYGVFLKQCDETLLEEFLQAPHAKPAEFMWKYERRLKPFLLSAEEEKTISDLHPLLTWAGANSMIKSQDPFA